MSKERNMWAIGCDDCTSDCVILTEDPPGYCPFCGGDRIVDLEDFSDLQEEQKSDETKDKPLPELKGTEDDSSEVVAESLAKAMGE